MKKLLICLCLMIGLVGCSKSETVTVCSISSTGLVMENTIVAQSDKIVKQTLVNQIDFEMAAMTKEQVEELVQVYVSLYNIEGVEYSYEIEGSILTETIVIDYSKASLEDLQRVELIQNIDDVEYISLEKTIDSLESTGFICK